MASPASLLLLLLVLSALLISTMIGPAFADQKQLQEMPPVNFNKVKEGFKKVYHFSDIDRINSFICPFLEIIPVCGPMISGLVKFAASEIKGYDTIKPLMDEFENLNTKLDHYHVEQTWNSWASGAYYKPEMDIKLGWTHYTTLLKSLGQAKDAKEMERHTKDFKKAYLKYEPATKTLYNLLTATGATFINSLGNLLAKHVNCHEKAIRDYTMFINKLIYKGNTMNEFYYKLKDIQSDAKADNQAEIAYKAASVMFQIHKQCINNSMDYIIKDVTKLIDKNEKHSELAKKVCSFLMDVYDRYDWMVVAFMTTKSNHKMITTLNRHVLSGFTEVIKDRVSVAVARQVKGTHTKALMVKKAIEKCISESVLCYKVAEKLGECSETVEGKPVSQTYTAVHAYLRKNHESHSAQKVPEDYDINASPEDISDQTPYIYRGECQRFPLVKGGKFVVLIKSDEEIMTEDPCSKLDCGEEEKRGSCVRMPDMFLAMCQCNKDYYGQNCEESLYDYKMYLQGKILAIEWKSRSVGSRQ